MLDSGNLVGLCRCWRRSGLRRFWDEIRPGQHSKGDDERKGDGNREPPVLEGATGGRGDAVGAGRGWFRRRWRRGHSRGAGRHRGCCASGGAGFVVGRGEGLPGGFHARIVALGAVEHGRRLARLRIEHKSSHVQNGECVVANGEAKSTVRPFSRLTDSQEDVTISLTDPFTLCIANLHCSRRSIILLSSSWEIVPSMVSPSSSRRPSTSTMSDSDAWSKTKSTGRTGSAADWGP